MIQKYWLIMLIALSTVPVFGQDVEPALIQDQSSGDASVKKYVANGLSNMIKVISEGAQITYQSIFFSAYYCFIPAYVTIHLLSSGVPSVSDLIKALNKDERLRYASFAGALGFLLYYNEVFSLNGKYINLTESEFDAAVENRAKELAKHDPDMPQQEIQQKALAYVTQKVNAAPARLLGACCSLAACAGAAYMYHKNG